MKFTINSADLLSALTMLNRAQASKNALPILDCIRMELTANGLHLTAADSDQTLETDLPVIDPSDINQCVCIPAAQFLSALKELPSQPITFMGDDTTWGCRLDYANGHFNFIAHDPMAFPLPPKTLDKAQTLTIPANIFAQAISYTKNSVGHDDLRPQMNGMAVDVQADGNIVFVASDGHSLTRYIYKNANTIENPFLFIIPEKAAQLLSSLLARQTDDISININDTSFIITVGNYTLYARLIEGRYPNYNSVIPTNNPFFAMVERDALVAAIRRVLVFASAATALIQFSFDKDKLKISAQDFDFNTSAEETLACEYDHQPISIGFSGTLLIDLLKQMPNTTLKVSMTDPSRPGIITPAEQNEEEDILLLLMPMMLKA